MQVCFGQFCKHEIDFPYTIICSLAYPPSENFSSVLVSMQETTMFLQMLYNPVFKQQYSEELVEHYAFMIESVIQKVHDRKPNAKEDFKALDSSLDRGMWSFDFY